MSGGDIAFVLLSINPLGGLLMSIPLAVLELGYPPWFALLAGVPLAYVQVLVVDLAWNQLCRIGWWNRLLERRRSRRLERLVQSGGAFWPTVVLTPFIGPWMIMAFMRYARIPQRHVAVPILLGIGWMASLVAISCVIVPEWFSGIAPHVGADYM